MEINYNLKTALNISELNMVEVYVNIYDGDYIILSNSYMIESFIKDKSLSISTDVIERVDPLTQKTYGIIIQAPIIMETKELTDLINILCDKIHQLPNDDITITYNISFDDSYFLKENIPFEEALSYLKQGCKACRNGWNGKGMFVVIQKAYPEGIPCNKQTAEVGGLKEGDLFNCNPYFQITNVDGSHSMWVPSVGDLVAEDWFIMKK